MIVNTLKTLGSSPPRRSAYQSVESRSERSVVSIGDSHAVQADVFDNRDVGMANG